MGFYLRKSVSLGPFRFNLSGSGVGMSVGVRGFRVGSGPRGNYVRIGRGNVYYRQTLPVPSTPRVVPAVPAPAIPSGTHGAFQEIESGDVARIVDTSSQSLLDEVRDKRRKIPLVPFAVGGAVLLMVMALAGDWPGWLFALITIVAVAAIIAAAYRDKLAKTVVVLYELESEVEEAFKRFVQWADAVASSARAWHVASAAQVYDRKYHAGAGQLVQRNATALQTRPPSFLKTNVPIFSLGVGQQTLYFMPDRLLVFDGANVGGVSYRSLELVVTRQQFVEETGVPRDATVVGHTWRYVNKSGGPDRRFNNNPQLPICLYDELSLRTISGLNEIVQLSRSGVAEGFAAALRHLATVVPQA
jgi:hypothetical protein